VLNPEDFVRYVTDVRGLNVKAFRVPETVIMIYGRELFDRLVELTNAKKPEVWLYDPEFFPIRYGEVSSKGVTLIRPGIGAPSLVFIIEELIACGGKTFLLIGFAGSLQKHVNIGDFVVGTSAIRDEGTSYHYLARDVRVSASKELTDVLMKCCNKHGVKFHSGTVWTTDAPYRETRRKVLRHQRQGVLCVEMETAALFSLAVYRGVKAGSLLRISDSIAELRPTLAWWDSPILKQIEEKVALIILDAIKTV